MFFLVGEAMDNQIKKLSDLINTHMAKAFVELKKAESFRMELNRLIGVDEPKPLVKQGNGGTKIQEFYKAITYEPTKVEDLFCKVEPVSEAVISQHRRFDKYPERGKVKVETRIDEDGAKYRVIYRIK